VHSLRKRLPIFVVVSVSIDAEKEIVDMLKSGAQQIVQRGEMSAAQAGS